MARIETVVTMKGIYRYERPAFGYGSETAYIYNMEAEDGTVYVWKTTSFMTVEVPYTGEKGWHSFEDSKGNPVDHRPINKGDMVRIKATVKGQSEYKGQPQTEVNRVKVVERLFAAKTPEEIEAERKAASEARKQEQLESIGPNDLVWSMPYRQYKEHYSDCETLEGSFQRKMYSAPTIAVIIREGRLKESGVRGEHYSGYRLQNKEGKQVVYRAVKEENAIRRAVKEFGGEWECIKVYQYNLR